MEPITQDRTAVLARKIQDILYELSGLEPADLTPSASWLELGFDSLFLSQAVIQFNQNLGLRLSFRQMFEETPSIDALARYADEVLPPEAFQPAPQIIQNADNQSFTNKNIPASGITERALPALTGTSDSTVAEIIRRQLEVMEQQLAFLKNGDAGANPAPGFSTRQAADPLFPTKPDPETKTETNAGEDRTNTQRAGTFSPQKTPRPAPEKNIARPVKGVTPKMANYQNIQANDDLAPAQKAALEKFIAQYVEKTAKSKAQAQRHRARYADPRSVTGFSNKWKEIVYQIAAEEAKGAKIRDVDGNEYVDFVMSYGVALFGHMPDFVQKAVAEQLEKGASLDVLPPKATEIAEMLAEMTGMERVTLANTGTEAVLGAVRAARTWSGKDKIAVFDTDYHGMVGQFMLRGVFLKDRTNVLPAAAGIPRFVVENTLVLDYDDPDVLSKLETEIKDLAAVVIEPVQAQNPHWQHPELIRKIREITARHDVALIFDEIINGFRLDQKGAQAWYGVEADLVAYGKSVSGGLPLSAVAGKAKYMAAFDGGWWQFGDDSAPEGTMTYFASTFIKNPVSVAAAHAAVSELKRRGPELQYELNARAARFARRVADIFRKMRAPYFIQCTSSMFMIKPADANPYARLFHYFLRYHGVNMRERPCFISTAHTDSDFEKTFRAIENALRDMFEAGLIEPYAGDDLNQIILPPAHLRKGDFWENETTPLDLTEGQKEVFVNALLGDDANAAYNVGTEIMIEGETTTDALRDAIQKLTDRHEALRIFFAKDGQKQFVREALAAPVAVEDISDRSEKAQSEFIQKRHEALISAPFDLFRGPLFRVEIIRRGPARFSVLWVVHHAVADGWSLGILTRELGHLLKPGGKNNLPPAVPFRDFVVAQRDFRQGADYAGVMDFWVKKFASPAPPLDLPTDFPRPPRQSFSAECERLAFSETEYKTLRKTAARFGTTPYFYLFAAFQTYLSRLTGQTDLTIGVVAAGQNAAGFANLVGHAANLLPVRMEVPPSGNFSDWLKTVRRELLDAFDHQNFTFGELVRKLRIPGNSSRNPLISLVFNMDSPLDNLDYGDLRTTTRP
ncbi:MAG: aminotransferase class III-fold pyridoxal phosphate-dependent enzyme, partial [Bacteroidetes bacterium]